MNIKKYRHIRECEAVDVTIDDLEEIATWCEGIIQHTDDPFRGHRYVVSFPECGGKLSGIAEIGQILVKIKLTKGPPYFTSISNFEFHEHWNEIEWCRDIDTADIVYINGTKEECFVIRVEDGYVHCSGYLKNPIKIEKCELKSKASDVERTRILMILSELDGPHADYARERLSKE